MTKFEDELQNKHKYLPKIWLRYVHDIFAIFDLTECSVDDFHCQMNSKFIKLTYKSNVLMVITK